MVTRSSLSLKFRYHFTLEAVQSGHNILGHDIPICRRNLVGDSLLDGQQQPISLKVSGIQKSWRSMTPLKMKNKVGHTSSTILNSCSFQRYRLSFWNLYSILLTQALSYSNTILENFSIHFGSGRKGFNSVYTSLYCNIIKWVLIKWKFTNKHHPILWIMFVKTWNTLK